MKIFDTLPFAIRNLARRKLRTFLTSFAVFIGIFLLTVMISLGLGIRKWLVDQITAQVEYTRVTVTQKGALGGGGSLFSEGSSGLSSDGEEDEIKVITPKVIEEIKDIEHTTQVQPMLIIFAQKLQIEGQEKFLKTSIGSGWDVEENDAYNKGTIAGDLEDWYQDNSNILLTNRTLDNYELSADDAMGKKVTLTFARSIGGPPMLQQDIQTEELTFEFNVVGIIDVGLDQNNFCISADAGALILSKTSNYASKEEYIKQAGYPFVYVNTDDLNNTQGVAEKIDEMGFQALTVEDLIGFINQIFLVIEAVLATFGIIALLIAALGIINTMIMSIYERTKEIGLMKSVGAKKSDVRLIFTIEAGLIGFLGGALGSLSGYGANFIANEGLNYFLKSQGEAAQDFLYFPWWLIVVGISFAVILGMLAGLYPANKAANLDPIDALRYE